MTQEELTEACEQIYASLVDGIAPQQQLPNLLVYFEAHKRDEIEEAFWQYYDEKTCPF